MVGGAGGRSGSRPLSWELFDRAPDSSAVLDITGRILAVNRAWRTSARGLGALPAGRVGSNYLSACRRAAADGQLSAARAVTGLIDVFGGSAFCHLVDYPSQTPTGQRWFRAQAFVLPAGGQVVVRHVEITDLIIGRK